MDDGKVIVFRRQIKTHSDDFGSKAPTGNADAAAHFLKHWFRPGKPIEIFTIQPEGSKGGQNLERHTYSADDEARLRRYMDAAQGKLNLHFPINYCEMLPGCASEHPKECETVGMRAVPVDLNWKHLPKEVGKEGALDWLQTIEQAPSIIMESGGGYWAFWLVSDGADMGGPATVQRKDDKSNLSHRILYQ